MLKDKFLTSKLEYKEYILLLKSGNFYLSLNKDAVVLSNLFNYKIKDSSNFIKTGFLISSLNKVAIELENKHVNYTIIDDSIISKQVYKDNNYSKYITDIETYISRIKNINEILDKIENVLCRINY